MIFRRSVQLPIGVTCLCFGLLIATRILGQSPALNSARYDGLRPGMAENEVEAVFGFAGFGAIPSQDAFDLDFMNFNRPDTRDYRWTCWQGGDVKVYVGFDSDNTLRWKIWTIGESSVFTGQSILEEIYSSTGNRYWKAESSNLPSASERILDRACKWAKNAIFQQN